TINFLLAAQNLGVLEFQAKYSCRYFFADKNTLIWEPVGEGNTFQSGKAIFQSTPDGQTEIAYTETVEMEIELPALMVPMLNPVFTHAVVSAIKNYLKLMIESLPVRTIDSPAP
ncbi:MAG: hypothetical protein HN348_26570, partial [Proteobacteria bacterium]|nr:hypothetical protein [Pseudomonadota bacterium]